MFLTTEQTEGHRVFLIKRREINARKHLGGGVAPPAYACKHPFSPSPPWERVGVRAAWISAFEAV